MLTTFFSIEDKTKKYFIDATIIDVGIIAIIGMVTV